MKTLKRSLALVLALVMVLGVMTISAGAAFNTEQIKYTEAVDVLTGLRAIEGFPDGTYRPTNSLTRAQAATMMARILLGRAAADALTCQDAPFADVPATHWAAPEIAFCVSRGVIQGYGNGTFGPENNLTGVQVAAMLLRALGYGKNGEYSGSYWDVNVVADANYAGIFTGTQALDLSAAANREETALYAFNALSANTVLYNKDTETYVVKTTPYTDPQTQQVTNYAVTLAGDRGITKITDQIDGYGYTAHFWSMYGENLTGKLYADEPVAVTYVGGQRVAEKAQNFYTDAVVYVNGEVYTERAASAFAEQFIPAGAKVSFVKDLRGYVTKVVVTAEHAAVVGNVINANARTGAPRMVTGNVYYANGQTTTFTVASDTLTKGTILTVVPNAKYTPASDEPAFLEMTEAQKVTGTYTKNYLGTLTISGVAYPGSANMYTGAVPDFDFGSTADFYFDTMGNIVYVSNVQAQEVNLNYVYVADTASRAAGYNLLQGVSTAVAKASIINLDGTVAVVDVSTYVGQNNVTYYTGYNVAVDNDNVPTPGGHFYSYTLDDNGAYIFHAVNADLAKENVTVRVERGNASISGVTEFANSRTQLTVISNDGTSSVTGIANFPREAKTYEAVDPMHTLVLVSKGVVTNIYVVTGKNAPAVTTAATYAYYMGPGATELVNGQVIQYQTFYVDGALVSYPVANGNLTYDKVGTVYSVTLTNGVATVTEQTLTAKAEVVAVDDTFFVLDTGAIVYYDTDVGCPVYNVVTYVGNGVADTVEVGDTVQYVANTDGHALVVYIVDPVVEE